MRRDAVLITGGNSGIGFECARELARDGWHVIIASRNRDLSVAAVQRIVREHGNDAVEEMGLDLASLQAVREFAKQIHVRDIQLRNQACAIFIDPGQQIWIATGTDGQFMKIDADGKVLGYAGRRGTGLGELSEAHMLAVAPSGDVYVADTLGKKVERFVPAAR